MEHPRPGWRRRDSQYAVFYNVEGTTYWDNNFGLNYSF